LTLKSDVFASMGHCFAIVDVATATKAHERLDGPSPAEIGPLAVEQPDRLTRLDSRCIARICARVGRPMPSPAYRRSRLRSPPEAAPLKRHRTAARSSIRLHWNTWFAFTSSACATRAACSRFQRQLYNPPLLLHRPPRSRLAHKPRLNTGPSQINWGESNAYDANVASTIASSRSNIPCWFDTRSGCLLKKRRARQASSGR